VKNEENGEITTGGSVKGGKEENNNDITNGRRGTYVLFNGAINCKVYMASVVDG
jgi:hypothetical protein